MTEHNVGIRINFQTEVTECRYLLSPYWTSKAVRSIETIKNESSQSVRSFSN